MSSSIPNPDPQLYGRSFTDVYDHWYNDLDDPSHLVQAFQQRCAVGATIVELGSGTGRLAAPLEQAGFRVLALDASTAMLRLARAGPHSIAADMAAMPIVDGHADAVLIAYNTILNLDGPEQQQRCFHEIARILRPGGVAAIEAFVADTAQPSSFGVTVRSHPTRAREHIAIVTGPDAHDPDVIVGSHIELGRSIVCRPWRLRYASPQNLDQTARNAGLGMGDRHQNWTGKPFDESGNRHVTWYERR